MVIGDQLRSLREHTKLSQGHFEERTELFGCYVSRVENGHTVPSIETLEKFARALEVPMYQLFYDGEQPPRLKNLFKGKSADEVAFGSTRKEARVLARLRRLLATTSARDRVLLLVIAQKVASGQ